MLFRSGVCDGGEPQGLWNAADGGDGNKRRFRGNDAALAAELRGHDASSGVCVWMLITRADELETAPEVKAAVKKGCPPPPDAKPESTAG